MSKDTSQLNKSFEGFERPEQNYFRLPNSWTDLTAGMKSLAELKVVEYVARHTWGFSEFGIYKLITLDEFIHGRKKANGERLDKGTGLSKPSVIEGIRLAIDHGFLVETVDSHDRARVKKSYMLKIKGGQGDLSEMAQKDPQEPKNENVKNLNADVKNLYPGVKNVDSSGKESLHRTEKETLERNITVNGYQKVKNEAEDFGGTASYTANRAQNEPKLKNPIRELPNLELDKAEIKDISAWIATELGDKHSGKFYYLVAAKIPKSVIHEHLKDAKGAGENPAKLFTHRMNAWAIDRLETMRVKERMAAIKRDVFGGRVENEPKSQPGMQSLGDMLSSSSPDRESTEQNP
jgi:hypothetical protein